MTDTNQKTQSTTQSAKKAGSQAADKMQEKAQDAAGRVSEEMTGAAEKTRSGAARNVKDMADAMHSAADQLDDGTSQRRVFDMVAENLEQVSDALQSKDMGEMMRDLNALARRHPVAFLGGAALVGFAATRLMTASSSGRNSSSSADMRTGGTTSSGMQTGSTATTGMSGSSASTWDEDRNSTSTPGARTGTTGV
jgi:hypothetical protein